MFSASQPAQKGSSTRHQSRGSAGHQLASGSLPAFWKSRIKTDLHPIVVSAGITDPVNIGSVFRICDAVGCQKILFIDTPVNKLQKLKNVSRRLDEKIAHEFISAKEFIERYSEFPHLVAIEITTNSTDVFRTSLPQNAIFVLGGEQFGIPEPILEICSQAVHIPMYGVGGAMNVATSLGIVLYEWRRRLYESI